MGDWQEIAPSVGIALIFAFIAAKLISVLSSCRNDNSKMTGQQTVESTIETHGKAQIPSENYSTEEQSQLHNGKGEIAEKSMKRDGKTLEMEGNTLEFEGKSLKDDGFDGRSMEESGSGDLYGEGYLDEEDDWEGVQSTELEDNFGAATSYVASMAVQSSVKISNDVQLQFYGLYKIATEGPCGAPQPSALKMTARAKWNAWQRLGTMSAEAAMQKYITLLTEIQPKWVDGIKKKCKKKEEEKSQRSTTTEVIGPVFSTFINPEGSDDEIILEAIHSHASEGDITSLVQALEQGIPIDLEDSQGRTALHWAVDRGHMKVIEALISKGAYVNAKDAEGQTPLHYATVCEREDIAKYLIDNGADTSVKDNDGATPYSLCPSMSGKA